VSGSRIVDLSLPIESNMPHFEGTPPVYVAQSHRLDDEGYRMCTVLFGNHAGTHLDAPSHFLADGASVEHVDLDRCVGEATVLDLTHKEPLSPITVADVLAAGAGTDPGQRLLLRTDWDSWFGQPAYFTDFPPLAPETARWFADHGVLLVGLDIPSLHQTAFVELHEVMLGAEIAIIESLVNLRSLTQRRVFLSAAPLKLAGADGAPVRAFAIESGES
jgi:kynurenine formamidase